MGPIGARKGRASALPFFMLSPGLVGMASGPRSLVVEGDDS
jgi:hypothetical protein